MTDDAAMSWAAISWLPVGLTLGLGRGDQSVPVSAPGLARNVMPRPKSES